MPSTMNAWSIYNMATSGFPIAALHPNLLKNLLFWYLCFKSSLSLCLFPLCWILLHSTELKIYLASIDCRSQESPSPMKAFHQAWLTGISHSWCYHTQKQTGWRQGYILTANSTARQAKIMFSRSSTISFCTSSNNSSLSGVIRQLVDE